MDWWRKKKNKKKQILERGKLILEREAMLLEDLIECCDGKYNPIKFFSADEILKSTDRYKWYSGKNKNQHKILITKDLPFNRYRVGEGIFCRDIAVSSMVSKGIFCRDIAVSSMVNNNSVFSEKTDVFAIGNSLQKLLMGQKRFCEICRANDDEGYDAAIISNIMLNFMVKRSMDEIADPEMLEMMCEISEEELCQMKAFLMLSLRCMGLKGEVPTMVEVAKELKKIQRSLNHDSFSPSGETQFDSAQVISSTVALSNQTVSTKALLTGVACQFAQEIGSEAKFQRDLFDELGLVLSHRDEIGRLG